MEKKYYVFSLFLLLSLIISIVSTSGNYAIEVVENGKISNPSVINDGVNPIVDNENELVNENIDNNDDNENIDLIEEEPITETIYDNLVFSDEVTIFDIKEIDDEYIAIGTKNNSPFIQMLKLENNKLVVDLQKTDFNLITGKVTDLIRRSYFLTATINNNTNNTVYQDFFISNNKIIPYYKKQINLNYSKNAVLTPKYLVIHETNNTRAGADANAHYRYWNSNPDAKASTHFVVDSKQIYQMLELDQVAWHVGDNKGYSDITNLNSIGIEIAVNSDGNYEEARQHTIELTIQIMKELNMDITQLKRHYDASGKRCPLKMIEDPSLWTDFVNQVNIGLNS